MSEPRQRARPKGPHFPPSELSTFLSAYGDAIRHPPPTSTSTKSYPSAQYPSYTAWLAHNTPLPETISVLDEILTDYILETCHLAAIPAQLSHRSKIKLDDFKFALRKDPRKLGRMNELLMKQKEILSRRKAFEVEEGEVARREAGLGDEEGGVGVGGKRKGRGRGRKRKAREEVEEAEGGGGSEGGRSRGKRRKTEERSSDVE